MNLYRPLLIVVAAAQLAIPATMIHRQETILRDGREYKFKTRPVDPADAFRGRYVWLGFEQDHAPWKGPSGSDEETHGRHGQNAFATLAVDANGFAQVSAIAPSKPASGDFLKVQVSYRGWGTNVGDVWFSMPFDRYYMEESKAPEAERVYWQHQNRRTTTNHMTFAVVRVLDGRAALENVILDGRPIAEYVKEKSR
jgi:uncharacterized membrane-anchored protein